MKFEAVFGDQSLFDGAPDDAEAVGCGKPHHDAVVFYKFSNGEFQYKYKEEGEDWKVSTCENPQSVIKAMRRIIVEPKRWTVEDQKAGRMPEVGVLVEYFANNDHFDTEITGQWRNGDELEILRGQNKNKAFVVFNKRTEQISNLIINCMKPIETPDEKAARLREEWCSDALGSASILSGMKEYELKRLGGYVGNIYDALLSGELSMPSKGGE